MKKRIFSILTALCLCLTLLPTMAAAEETAGTATEVKTSDELVGALADPNVTTIKLMRNITVNATENVKELTVDRPITLEKGGEDNSCVLYLYRPLTIAESGALTLKGGVFFYPYDRVTVNGSLTVGAGCEVIFEGNQSFLTINQGGTVTTQPAGENTISGLLSLGKNAALTVDGALVNNGRLSVSDMANLKLAASIGGDLILNGVTVDKDYTLDMQGNLLTICDSRDFSKNANLTVKNASRVVATGVTISGGSYYCPVYAGDENGEIEGGSFYGPVTVRYQGSSEGRTPAYISGGTFYDKLKGAYAETDYSIQGREVTYMGGEDVYAMQVVNDKASAPDTPVKSGYRFVGWYSGDAKWDFDTLVTENLTLTAKWEKIHTSAPSAPRYDVAVSDGAHGSVTVSPKSASKGSTVTVTVTPDKGYALETLTVTDKNGSTLDLTDRGNGKYTFTMPSGPVTVAATFMDDNTMLNFFVDVPAGAYYYDAVLWAAEGGIVTGTDAVHFSPDASCTRAQLVTFLWRAAGSPAVNYAMNFTDVDSGAYYAEAVRWAASEKVVEGTTAETFAPDAAVTRAQMVTMLYRFAKAQGMDTTQGGMAIREYADYDSLSEYAREAMAWAVNTEILKGSNNRLLPDAACTRAQLVTLLYRLESQTTDKVDYSGDVTGWMYAPESKDTLVNLLVSIDTVAHGSAGGSLQQANAAVSLMKLAMNESGKVEEAAKTYLAGMNATQKDFFSFQWQQALRQANALLDGSEDPAILDDAGDAGFDLKAVSSAKVDALDKTVTELLRDAGVTDEWKNHTDLEPFNAA